MNEEIERYVVLLLGVIDRPVPSMWHLEKEIFMLSRASPKVQEFFNFEKHYNGPYSPILQEVVTEPLLYKDAYEYDENGKVSLTSHGKTIFRQIKHENKDNEKFDALITLLELIRQLYDKLSRDELLFLIYRTYPEYIDFSNVYDKLVLDMRTRIRLAESLLHKGLVTEERYKELIEAE